MSTRITLSTKGKVLKTETDKKNTEYLVNASKSQLMDCTLFNSPWIYREDPANEESKAIGFTPLTLSILRQVREKSLTSYELARKLNINNEVITMDAFQALTDLLYTLESLGYIQLATEKTRKSGSLKYVLNVAIRNSGADILFGADSVILNTKQSDLRISTRND